MPCLGDKCEDLGHGPKDDKSPAMFIEKPHKQYYPVTMPTAPLQEALKKKRNNKTHIGPRKCSHWKKITHKQF